MLDRQVLAAAARFERDRRLERAPKAIAQLASVGGDGPATREAICIDCQCWTAIAEWFDTGRFAGFYGGDEPHLDTAPWISWPELEAAARKALAKVEALITKSEAGNDPNDLAEATVRRAKLICIHRALEQMRGHVDMLNRELRSAREKTEAA